MDEFGLAGLSWTVVIVDTWMEENPIFLALLVKTTTIEIIKVKLDNRESKGSAIQLSLRTRLLHTCNIGMDHRQV